MEVVAGPMDPPLGVSDARAAVEKAGRGGSAGAPGEHLGHASPTAGSLVPHAVQNVLVDEPVEPIDTTELVEAAVPHFGDAVPDADAGADDDAPVGETALAAAPDAGDAVALAAAAALLSAMVGPGLRVTISM